MPGGINTKLNRMLSFSHPGVVGSSPPLYRWLSGRRRKRTAPLHWGRGDFGACSVLGSFQTYLEIKLPSHTAGTKIQQTWMVKDVTVQKVLSFFGAVQQAGGDGTLSSDGVVGA